jgi:hypothetical protein
MHIFGIIALILVVLMFVLSFYSTTSIYKYHPGIVNARWRIKAVRDWNTSDCYDYYIQVKPHFIWWYVESWGELSYMKSTSYTSEESARRAITKFQKKIDEAYNKHQNLDSIRYIDI